MLAKVGVHHFNGSKLTFPKLVPLFYYVCDPLASNHCCGGGGFFLGVFFFGFFDVGLVI